jgi:hypothetical protein
MVKKKFEPVNGLPVEQVEKVAKKAIIVPPEPPKTVTHEQMIVGALNAVMQQVAYVQKTGKVKFGSTNYTYASEQDILAVARPYFVAAGLILTPNCTEMNESGNKVFVRVEYTLAHTSGAVWPHPLSMWGCGEDKGDKALYKALTGANKYLWAKMLQLATGDDAESGIQPEQHKKISNMDQVKSYCLREHGGADDASRKERMTLLNGLLIAVNCDPVDNPTQITTQQWDAMAANLPL